MSFSSMLNEWTAQHSSAGFTTTKTACITFRDACNANFPVSGIRRDVSIGLVEDKLLHLMEELAGNFRGVS